jgi:hypothetical protein
MRCRNKLGVSRARALRGVPWTPPTRGSAHVCAPCTYHHPPSGLPSFHHPLPVRTVAPAYSGPPTAPQRPPSDPRPWLRLSRARCPQPALRTSWTAFRFQFDAASRGDSVVPSLPARSKLRATRFPPVSRPSDDRLTTIRE